MRGLSLSAPFQRERLNVIADALVVASAVSLPWSTSATSILLVMWLVAFVPVMRPADLYQELRTASGALPVLLVVLGAAGMVWADVSLSARLGGLDGFVKILCIPIFMVQFRYSAKAPQVFVGFLVSCIVLLIASTAVWLWPDLPKTSLESGVPVKNHIVQSLEFTICAAFSLYLAVESTKSRRWLWLVAYALLLFGFLGNVLFVAASRTALAILPVLVLAYGFRTLGWRGLFGAGAIGLVLAGTILAASPYVRLQLTSIYTGALRSETKNVKTSPGERIIFWTKSLKFIANAPVIGHGTGTITEMFREASVGKSGVRGVISTNPHNQTFTVGIQLGLMGIIVLWAMWISQFALFRGSGLVAWIGLVIVLQNIVGSLFNSFISDFTEGWIYVVGVGVASGVVLGKRDSLQSGQIRKSGGMNSIGTR